MIRPRFLQTKKTLAYGGTVGMYHVGFLRGMELGWVVVLYCTVWLCTYLIRTRWGVSDLLDYQAYCNKARREWEREGERRDRGRGGWRSSIRRCLRTNLFRQGVCAWAWGRVFSWYAPVCSPWDGCIRRFSHIHARCTHGVLGLLACCLFIRLSLFFCVCVYPCLADGRTDVLYH